MTVIDHETAAELLYVTGEVPATTVEAARAAVREFRRRKGDLAGLAGDMAADYQRGHAEIAPGHMARCLQLVPDRIEVPDTLTEQAMRLLGCRIDECASEGPFELFGRLLLCPAHRTAAVAAVGDAVWNGGAL